MDGAAVCTENYTRWLHAMKYPTAAVVPMVPGFSDSGTYPVFRYLSMAAPGRAPYRFGLPGLDPVFGRKVRGWLRANVEGMPLVVHSHAPFVSGRLAHRIVRWWRRQGGAALLVATLHSKYHEDLERALGKRFIGNHTRSILRHYRRADAVWAPNDHTAETLRKHGFEGRIDIVPNGADFPIPKPEECVALRDAGNDALGLQPETRLLLFVGQLLWQKNIQMLIDALVELNAMQAPDWKMVFVGAGADTVAMQKKVAAAGLEQRVQFHGLVLDRTELRAMYARAHLVLFPSLHDNAPLVIREAAAFAVPTVMMAGGNAARDTIDGRNAFHVRPEPDAVARMVWTLLRDPDRAKDVGLAAQSEVFLDWKSVVERVAVRYAALLERVGR